MSEHQESNAHDDHHNNGDDDNVHDTFQDFPENAETVAMAAAAVVEAMQQAERYGHPTGHHHQNLHHHHSHDVSPIVPGKRQRTDTATTEEADHNHNNHRIIIAPSSSSIGLKASPISTPSTRHNAFHTSTASSSSPYSSDIIAQLSTTGAVAASPCTRQQQPEIQQQHQDHHQDQHHVFGNAAPSSKSKTEPYTIQGNPVKTPHAHDVLMGRGKGIVDHVGNQRFRDFVLEKKRDYIINSWKYEKGETARQILESIATLDPPGRFLKFSQQDGLWSDVPTAKAFEKACQALRERKWEHPMNQPPAAAAVPTTSANEMYDNNVVMGNDHEMPVAFLSEPINNHNHNKPAVPNAATTTCGLLPGHPNTHISMEDIQKRIRAGARVSVHVPGQDRYISGKVIKRLSTRLQLQTPEGNMLYIDMNRDKIRIDSRKLNLNLRLKSSKSNNKDEAGGAADDEDEQVGTVSEINKDDGDTISRTMRSMGCQTDSPSADTAGGFADF